MRFSRDNVARYTLFIAAGLVVIGTSLQVWHSYHKGMDDETAAVVQFFGLITAAVASSLLASASYSLFHEYAAWKRTRSDQAALSSILYHSMHDPFPRCYIVLPRYSKKILVESSSPQYRSSSGRDEVGNQGPTGPVMRSGTISEEVGFDASSVSASQAASSQMYEIEMPYEHHACEDVRCAVELHALLVQAGAESVDWINPDKMDEIKAKAVAEPCVMLCIGLFSNECVKALASGERQTLFKMKNPDFTIAGKAIVDQGRRYKIDVNAKPVTVSVPQGKTLPDAFMLRFALQANVSCVIVGGVSAEGTQAIGRYIRLNWKKLIGATDINSGCSVRDREYIVHVASNSDPQSVTIERVVVGNEVSATLAPKLQNEDVGSAA